MSVELRDSYESIFNRAVTQMVMGNIQEATDLMLRIVNRLSKVRPETLERKPNRQALLMNAWNSAVQFLRWEKRFDEAITISDQLGQSRPDLSIVPVHIASLMIEKGDVEEGLARLRQLAEKTQDFVAWSRLATEYLALKRYAEAEACYQSTISVAQSNAQAASIYAGLFSLYQETDRVEDALEAWNMRIILSPEQATLAYQVYRWLIERGDLEQAQQYLEREMNPILRHFYQGLLDWCAGRQGQAKRQWEQVLDMSVGKDSQAIAEWMETALRLDKPEAVVDLANDLDTKEYLFPEDEAVLVGVAHAMLGDVEKAQTWFRNIVLQLKRRWPSLDKIPSKWAFLTSMVPDEKTLQAVAPYFERP